MIASPMCRVSWAADCCSDCRSVLMARNSTPSTSASTIRLTALTPAPPTPTTRSTGRADGLGAANASAGALGPGEDVGLGRRRRVRGRAALEQVLRDVGGERVAQALLRRGTRRSCGLGLGLRARTVGRARSAAPAPLGGRSASGGACGAGGARRGRARRLPVVLGGLAEQGRERALAHARALTGWHLRGPPSRAA